VAPGELSTSYPGAVTYVEVALFEQSHFHELGVDVEGAMQRQYCCSPWVSVAARLQKNTRTGKKPNRKAT
jgi:hypothetical protein